MSARSSRRAHRLRRRVALLVLTALALMFSSQQAVADGAEFGAVDLPSLSSMASWLKGPQDRKSVV